jgi:hypothetical protein
MRMMYDKAMEDLRDAKYYDDDSSPSSRDSANEQKKGDLAVKDV